jgi:PKD repeat protein
MGTLNPHFGIGLATEIDSVVVKWPSGNVDVICNPAINSTLFVEEGTGLLPIADFSASETTVTAGDIVNFTDESMICPTSWTWSVDQATGWTFVNGTSASSQNPEIQFTSYGTYIVSLTATNSNGDSDNIATEQVFVESGAGIENYESENLVLFPNPTEETLQVQFAGSAQGASSKIISTIGSEVMSFDNIPGEIEVSSLRAGTYFLVVVLPNGSKLTKLFVKK